MPALHGAAESLVLAQAAHALKAEGRMLAILVADAPAAQRLLTEIAWFGQRDGQALEKIEMVHEGKNSAIRAGPAGLDQSSLCMIA